MAKFTVGETVSNGLSSDTVRLGAGSGAANNVTSAEKGKIVKLVGESRYNLAAIGDGIEGFIEAVEEATQDGFTIGSVAVGRFREVTFEGTEAAGTGAITVGQYVVTGTPVAKGTALTGPANVRSATAQTDPKVLLNPWRVVSLGTAGTGAVGTKGIIQRVNHY
jgi:hypothetical protein